MSGRPLRLLALVCLLGPLHTAFGYSAAGPIAFGPGGLEPVPEFPDVAGALARLAAPTAAERAAAERDLASGLTRADAPLLAAAARAGSSEVRSRIASALKSDARHFAVAAALAASADPAVAAVGDEALAGQVATWLGTSDQEPLPLSAVERELRGAFSGLWRLELAGRGLEETLDRIARLVDARREDRPGAVAPALVLDPAFDTRAGRPLPGSEELGPVVVGTFEDLVYGAAVTHGAFFDVYGWEDGRTWVVVRAPGASSASRGRPAQALLSAWVREVERPASEAGATRAARALAASGWPAALLWLDARWREARDPAALDGLVLAAGRGAVASSLASADGAAVLLERADRALAQPGNAVEAAEQARALLAIGVQGSDAWTAGYGSAAPAARNLRAALVAATRACPPELEAALLARLQDPATSPEERCAVLRALAAQDEPPQVGAVPGLENSLAWAADHGEARALLAALHALAVAEPASWGTASGLAPAVQESLCADALAAGSGLQLEPTGEPAADLAGARLRTLLAGPRGEERALLLLDREALFLARGGLRGALAAARSAGADTAVILRLTLCAGVANAAEAEACARPVLERPAWSAADWRVAGAFVAREGGALASWPRQDAEPDPAFAEFLARLEGVRDALLAAQEAAAGSLPAFPAELDGMEAGWVQGVARALALLRARQCEPGARELLRNLRVRFQRVQHPLRRELVAGRFPPLSPALLVDVDAREPWLGF